MDGEGRTFDLAAAFLAEIAGRREPWPSLFEAWADGEGLSLEARRRVRVAVIRARVFHAVEGGGGDAA
jgi:hypothetical protein